MKLTLLSTLLFLSSYLNAQLDSIFDQGDYRTFRVHLPYGYDSNNEYPLVLNLHGLNANALQQQTYSKFNNVADQNGFIVVYPNGIDESWSTIGNKDSDFLTNLVDSIRADYSANNCLFVTGFSQGGFMTYKFANTTKHEVKAIAVCSGNMSNASQNAATNAPQIPIMHFHGTDDNIVSYNGTAIISTVENTVQWWVNHNNCNPTPVVNTLSDISTNDNSTVEKYYYGNGDNGSEVTFYKIVNGGHTWSGSTPINAFGNTNQDINQSEIIGTFFSELCSETLGIEKDKEGILYNLYPNPFKDEIKVEMIENEKFTFVLYDNLSRQVMKENFTGNTTINTAFLPEGIYSYEIFQANKELVSGKIVKN